MGNLYSLNKKPDENREERVDWVRVTGLAVLAQRYGPE
jgi:hypothetical protein